MAFTSRNEGLHALFRWTYAARMFLGVQMGKAGTMIKAGFVAAALTISAAAVSPATGMDDASPVVNLNDMCRDNDNTLYLRTVKAVGRTAESFRAPPSSKWREFLVGAAAEAALHAWGKSLQDVESCHARMLRAVRKAREAIDRTPFK